MRRLFATVFAVTLGAAGAATAQQKTGTYFFTGNEVTDAAHRAGPRMTGRPSAVNVFFTPVSNYRRSGFECVPLIEIATEDGRAIKRAGTVCRAVGI